MVCNKLVNPCSVFGGNNSKEYVVSFVLKVSVILFIFRVAEILVFFVSSLDVLESLWYYDSVNII